MKKVLLFIIGLLVLVIGLETYFIIKQNHKIKAMDNTIIKQNLAIETMKNNKNEELAKKVIVYTYNELKKAGNLSQVDTMSYIVQLQDIKSNVETISNSYSGNDADVKDMLLLINKFLNFDWDNRFEYDSMTKDEKNKYLLQSVSNYSKATDAINKCISKYALFDIIGLK